MFYKEEKNVYMKNKFLIATVFVLVISLCFVKVQAGILDDIIKQGTDFKGTSTSLGTKLSNFIKGDIMDIVSLVGNLVFAAVTVVLGAKYIWSSAEGRSQVMETLPGFILAVMFFYLGESMINWLTEATSGITSAKTWNTVAGNVIWIINTFVKYAAFGGILYLGLKYMFASAEGRSQLKTSMGGFVIGIIFVFLASNVVDYIIDIGESVL